jgi:oxygen-independent coproporphyrinogen III oxidase
MHNLVKQNEQELGIYVHIPFCQVKCSYCHFFTFAGKLQKSPQYFEALQKELINYQKLAKKYTLTTLYIGGGTPTLVASEFVAGVLDVVRQNYNLASDIEITIEANPESITPEKLDQYLAAGINRISIGVQAWQNDLLKYLNRLYTIDKFLQKLELVKQAGFKNINLDLIFGIPGQTLENWQESVQGVLSCGTQHLSCYSLELDNNSHWGQLYAAGKFTPANPELDREMYQYLMQEMKANGYEQYEMSNFAKSGFQCRHNLNFWLGKSYLGIGAAAHSYFEQARYHNIYSIEEYTAQTLANISTQTEITPLSRQEQMFEFLLLRLRLPQGINPTEFKSTFSVELNKVYAAELELLQNKAWVQEVDGILHLTKLGRDLYNQVAIDLLK